MGPALAPILRNLLVLSPGAWMLLPIPAALALAFPEKHPQSTGQRSPSCQKAAGSSCPVLMGFFTPGRARPSTSPLRGAERPGWASAGTGAGGLQQGLIQPRGSREGLCPGLGPWHGAGTTPQVPSASGDPCAPAPCPESSQAACLGVGDAGGSALPGPRSASRKHCHGQATPLQGQPRPHSPFPFPEATPAPLRGRGLAAGQPQPRRTLRGARAAELSAALTPCRGSPKPCPPPGQQTGTHARGKPPHRPQEAALPPELPAGSLGPPGETEARSGDAAVATGGPR